MDLPMINRGLHLIIQNCNKVYAEYARAKTEHENLDNQKKTILAVYELKHSEEGLSQAEIQRRALGDDEYQDYLVGLSKTAVDYNKAHANVKALETKLSCYQSLSKNHLKDHNLTSYET